VIRERFNIDGSTFPARMVPSRPYPSPVLFTMLLSVRFDRGAEKGKSLRPRKIGQASWNFHGSFG